MNDSTLREQLKSRQLLPHQVEFVETALDSMPGGRILLADDVGLGKTRACISLAWALAQKLGREPRMLILTPRIDIMRQWQARLADSGSTDALIVDAAAYRKLEAQTGHDENPWTAVRTALTTIDFTKRDDRLASLVDACWDLVILEDSHHATSQSQRGQVLRGLWDSPRVTLMVAVSATPDTGKAEDFELFTTPATRILRRRTREVRDWEGNSLIPDSTEQTVDVVSLELSSQERELFEAIRHLAAQSSAGRQFFAMTLVKRAASSLFALEQTVRRHLVKAGPVADRSADEPVAEAQVDLFEDSGDVEAVPQPIDRDELRSLLRQMDRIEVDSKWRACESVLDGENVGAGGSAVVFCNFVDTAEYLAELLASRECPVGVMTGSLATAERQHAYETFRNDGGVLIVTPVTAEGLNLSFVKLCIHYDIPWNATWMLQRFGRVHRMGATPGTVRHVLFSDEVLNPGALVQKLALMSEADFGIENIEDLRSALTGSASTERERR